MGHSITFNTQRRPGRLLRQNNQAAGTNEHGTRALVQSLHSHSLLRAGV